MNFGRETEDERIQKFMRIPPRKKLEWLYQMQQFILEASSKSQRKLRLKLRDSQRSHTNLRRS